MESNHDYLSADTMDLAQESIPLGLLVFGPMRYQEFDHFRKLPPLSDGQGGLAHIVLYVYLDPSVQQNLGHLQLIAPNRPD